MLKDECETSLMIESYNDTCIEHFNKNKKIVVANSEDKVNLAVANDPGTSIE